MQVKPVSESVFLRGWAKERCAKSGKGAILRCVGVDRRPLGVAPDENLFTHCEQANRRKIVAVIGIKKRFQFETILDF